MRRGAPPKTEANHALEMEVEPHRGCAFSIDPGPGGQFSRRRANPLPGGLPALHLSRASTNPIHTGIATYYYATGEGACGFPATPSDLMVTAINIDPCGL